MVWRVGSFGNQPLFAGTTWLRMDIDTKGNCGPVDDIVFFKSDSDPGSAATIWRLPLDGTFSGQFGGDSGFLPIGDYSGGGHYPWVVAISKTEGRILTMGFANTGSYSWHIKRPSDPPLICLTSVSIGRDGLATAHLART